MNRLLPLLSFVCIAGFSARAQNFVYRPTNPNFGGNTFNYSWLLSQAQAQDRNVDPNTRRTTTTTTTNSLQTYAQSLQNQLLSRITSNLVSRQFGEQDLREGTYRFGDYQVEIRNGTDGVVVRIVDGQGGETTITVPYF